MKYDENSPTTHSKDSFSHVRQAVNEREEKRHFPQIFWIIWLPRGGCLRGFCTSIIFQSPRNLFHYFPIRRLCTNFQIPKQRHTLTPGNSRQISPSLNARRMSNDFAFSIRAISERRSFCQRRRVRSQDFVSGSELRERERTCCILQSTFIQFSLNVDEDDKM